MKRILLTALLTVLLTVPGWSAGGVLNRSTVTKTSAYADWTAFTSSGTSTAVGVAEGAPLIHTVQVVVTGSPATCTINLDTSLDGVTWTNASGNQTCTSNITFYTTWVGSLTPSGDSPDASI